MEEREEKLFVGENIPASRATDFVAGFGSKELFITLIAAVVGLICGGIVYANTAQIVYAIMASVGVVVLTILLVYRNKFDESFVDYIMLIIRYYRSQKQYEYEYCNIYEEE